MSKWKPVGSVGKFQKWAEVGQELEGVWRGTSAGKFGDVGTLETASGPVQFSMGAVLSDRLGRVKVGAEVLIRYQGKAKGKSGTEFNSFEVFVSEADADAVDADGEGVPF